MKQKIMQIFNEYNKEDKFSGVFSVTTQTEVIFEMTGGFRNKAEQLANNYDTEFAIASGTKLFTALAVCKLVDEGQLGFADKIGNIIAADLGRINKDITIRQLLTHTSGVGDYIDEESPTIYTDLMKLYNTYPVYLWDNLSYYLQMSDQLPPKFTPGERYSYSNTGFVLLGLVIESITGKMFQQYVSDIIIKPCQLQHTGFYRTDSLPGNTAYGYLFDDNKQEWRSNIFSVPVIGGSDGGLFTCAKDLDSLWRKLMNRKILSPSMLQEFLTEQVTINEEYHRYCNLGMYQYKTADKVVYYAVGGDSGVDFFTAYFPEHDIVVSALGNTEFNTSPLLNELVKGL